MYDVNEYATAFRGDNCVINAVRSHNDESFSCKCAAGNVDVSAMDSEDDDCANTAILVNEIMSMTVLLHSKVTIMLQSEAPETLSLGVYHL